MKKLILLTIACGLILYTADLKAETYNLAEFSSYQEGANRAAAMISAHNLNIADAEKFGDCKEKDDSCGYSGRGYMAKCKLIWRFDKYMYQWTLLIIEGAQPAPKKDNK